MDAGDPVINQLTVAAVFAAYWAFGLATGWVLWGVRFGLSGPLPGYQAGRVPPVPVRCRRDLSAEDTGPIHITPGSHR